MLPLHRLIGKKILAYIPRGNVKVERIVRTLRRAIQKVLAGKGDRNGVDISDRYSVDTEDDQV